MLVNVLRNKKKYESMKECVFYVFLGTEFPLELTRKELCQKAQWRFAQIGLGSKELFECLAKLILYEWVETIDGVTFALTPYGFEIGKALIAKGIKFSKLEGVKTQQEKKKLLFDINDVRMKMSEEDIYELLGIQRPEDGRDCDEWEKEELEEAEKGKVLKDIETLKAKANAKANAQSITD